MLVIDLNGAGFFNRQNATTACRQFKVKVRPLGEMGGMTFLHRVELSKNGRGTREEFTLVEKQSTCYFSAT
jgi:hypothetical protein